MLAGQVLTYLGISLSERGHSYISAWIAEWLGYLLKRLETKRVGSRLASGLPLQGRSLNLYLPGFSAQ